MGLYGHWSCVEKQYSKRLFTWAHYISFYSPKLNIWIVIIIIYFAIHQFPFLLSGNRSSSNHRYQGSQGYKYLSWRRRDMLEVARVSSIGYTSVVGPKLFTWRELALLVTFRGWVQRTLSRQGFTSFKK